MKALLICLAMLLASLPADAAEAYPPHARYTKPAPQQLPPALRTLSKRSAAVLATDACWRGCTAQCGWRFQRCIQISSLDSCLAHNNGCELSCLKGCRLGGGPLVSWTDW